MLQKIRERIIANWQFTIVLVIITSYYIWRMFQLLPWYDETYTYYHFISNGPIYSVACWPAPNNHIFFSFLSSLIYKVFKGYIALRGISFISAVGTVIGVYVLIARHCGKNIALICSSLYALFGEVNWLAVQGRGYSLATFLLVLTVIVGENIIIYKDDDSNRKKAIRVYYVYWMLLLWTGLYTVMTSIYWVLAVCFAVGLVLLLSKQWGKLKNTIKYSVFAAILSVLSYSLICFTMGAVQLAENGFDFAEDIRILLSSPVKCFTTGFLWISGMLTGGRAHEMSVFIGFYKECVQAFLGSDHIILCTGLMLLICISIICSGKLSRTLAIKGVEDESDRQQLYFSLVVSAGLFFPILLTLLQGNISFVRNYSFVAVFLIFEVAVILNRLASVMRINCRRWAKLLPVVLSCGVLILAFTSEQYNVIYVQEYDNQDYWAFDAIQNIDWTNVSSYYCSESIAGQDLFFWDDVHLKKQMISVDCSSADLILLRKSDTYASDGMFQVQENHMMVNKPLSAIGGEGRSCVFENEMYVAYQ